MLLLFCIFQCFKPESLSFSQLKHSESDHIPADIAELSCPAHVHGVGKLCAELAEQAADALLTAAEVAGDEGTAHHDSVRTQGKGLENVKTGADAAVNDDLHLSANGVGDLGQYLCGGGDTGQHTAAVV